MEDHLSKNSDRKVYVGNILSTVTPALLFSLFSECGKIKTVQKKFPTYAFIEYEDAASVQKAIDSMNGSLVLGKKIVVNKVCENRKRNNVDGEISKTEEMAVMKSK